MNPRPKYYIDKSTKIEQEFKDFISQAFNFRDYIHCQQCRVIFPEKDQPCPMCGESQYLEPIKEMGHNQNPQPSA